jgi:outer membrane immunogenic protein
MGGVGGGFEWAWAPNWSTKLEYLRLDFGSNLFTIPFVVTLATGTPVHVNSHVDVVRLGLNYRFGNP